MPHRLAEASLQVVAGQSLVVPLIVGGLPEEVEALGQRWPRKVEFHLTAISARKLEAAGGGREDLWPLVTRVASGRALGPVLTLDEVRRVRDPERPGLRTLIVLAQAPGLEVLYADLSGALGARLAPQPAHVTLYSSDPFDGIGIDDADELSSRAPPLSDREQEEVRRAMRFEQAFGG